MIGDKMVEAQIREKEEAKQRYDDAIAGGHAAVLADKKKDAISLKIGNLLPGETATVSIGMVDNLELTGGAFGYTLPLSFFPDYGKHNLDNDKKNHFPYEFAYEFKVKAGGRITYISAPAGS